MPINNIEISAETRNHTKKANKCKHTIWRYRKNSFLNSKSELIYNERVSYLKRKSCEFACQPSRHVCESDWLINEISEFLANTDLLPDIPDNATDGCLLKLNYEVDDPEEGVIALWFSVYKEK